MPRDRRSLVFVGIKKSVVALDANSGAEIWRTELRASDYVTVLWDGAGLFAANSGEVWRIDPLTGSVVWHSELKGLGRGLVSLASSESPGSMSSADMAAEKRRREAATAAAAAG